MIVVKLQGGLGNQMFQYAAGLYLANKYKKPLFIDLSFLLDNDKNEHNFTARQYGLDIFKISGEIVRAEILKKNFNIGRNKGFLKKIFFQEIKIYNEESFAYDKNFINIPSTIYLNGYWQNWKYFTSIEQLVKQEFSFKPINLSPQKSDDLKKIINSNSVALHVRKTDYIHALENIKRYKDLSESYYRQAIDFIEKRVTDIKLFVFSDDPAWVKKQPIFQAHSIVIIDEEVLNNYNDKSDFILMCHCKHYIIANSTFSWWAAWLNPNITKMVIAPAKWFSVPPSGFEAENLLPKDWIRL